MAQALIIIKADTKRPAFTVAGDRKKRDSDAKFFAGLFDAAAERGLGGYLQSARRHLPGCLHTGPGGFRSTARRHRNGLRGKLPLPAPELPAERRLGAHGFAEPGCAPER